MKITDSITQTELAKLTNQPMPAIISSGLAYSVEIRLETQEPRARIVKVHLRDTNDGIAALVAIAKNAETRIWMTAVIGNRDEAICGVTIEERGKSPKRGPDTERILRLWLVTTKARMKTAAEGGGVDVAGETE